MVMPLSVAEMVPPLAGDPETVIGTGPSAPGF